MSPLIHSKQRTSSHVLTRLPADFLKIYRELHQRPKEDIPPVVYEQFKHEIESQQPLSLGLSLHLTLLRHFGRYRSVELMCSTYTWNHSQARSYNVNGVSFAESRVNHFLR